MEIKRKAARGIAVLAVALGAGYFVQNMGQAKVTHKSASADLATKPTHVETVAAGPEAVKPTITALTPAETTPALPAAPLSKPEPSAPEETAQTPAPQPVVSADPVVEKQACDITLDLMEEPNAMIGITLLAPCQPNQRLVIRHAGLAITAQTTATGSMFTSLPAMETAAKVEMSFADGSKAENQIAVPGLATLRRFGVQWQGDDAFQVHAFEDGASYADPGHVSAADPHQPPAGLAATGGFLTLVGDGTTENPLMAEIYTLPSDPAAKPEVVVEASVTAKTCGRELLGETLTSSGGVTFVTDLTLAMPECDAIGDYLMLKNLMLDLSMASAN